MENEAPSNQTNVSCVTVLVISFVLTIYLFVCIGDSISVIVLVIAFVLGYLFWFLLCALAYVVGCCWQ